MGVMSSLLVEACKERRGKLRRDSGVRGWSQRVS